MIRLFIFTAILACGANTMADDRVLSHEKEIASLKAEIASLKAEIAKLKTVERPQPVQYSRPVYRHPVYYVPSTRHMYPNHIFRR